MADLGGMPMRPAHPGPPMQLRGLPPVPRLRPEPIDRGQFLYPCPLAPGVSLLSSNNSWDSPCGGLCFHK